VADADSQATCLGEVAAELQMVQREGADSDDEGLYAEGGSEEDEEDEEDEGEEDMEEGGGRLVTSVTRAALYRYTGL